jgi:hypothetical protein
MKDYANVDAYPRRQSDQWPHEIAAIRPILLSCGLLGDNQVGKALAQHRHDERRPRSKCSPDHPALMFFQVCCSRRPRRGPFYAISGGPNTTVRSAKRLGQRRRMLSVEVTGRPTSMKRRTTLVRQWNYRY